MSDSFEPVPRNLKPPPLPPPPFVPAVVVGKPKRNNGCLIAFVVVAAISLFGVLLAIGACYSVVRLRDTFTDTAPVPLPTVETTKQKRDVIEARVKDFVETLRKQQPVSPLVLTERDLNILISSASEWEVLKGKVCITIQDDEIGGKISIPLDMFGFSFVKGRYLNGSATFSVFLRDGVLHVYFRTIEVKGKTFSDSFMAGMRQSNLAQSVNMDPKYREIFDLINSIETKDGCVVIVPKDKEQPGPLAPPAQDEPAADITPT